MKLSPVVTRGALALCLFSAAVSGHAQTAAAADTLSASAKASAQQVVASVVRVRTALEAADTVIRSAWSWFSDENQKRGDSLMRSAQLPWYWYSDERLKRDITLLERTPQGLGLYAYRYNWSDTVYVGVMAQEVAQVDPQAISTAANGYLQVDYQRLGLELVTLQQWVAAQRQ